MRDPENNAVFSGTNFAHLFLELDDLALEDKDLCHSCLVAVKEDFDEADQHIWDNLPSYFCLPDWVVLQEELEQAMKET